MATILIVDDLSVNRKLLSTLLRHEGHETYEAADGRQGLDAVHAWSPDLVITDVLMPVMDGYEFVRNLRRDPATSDIPVVLHTAHYAERDARTMAQSSGAAYVLTRPAESGEVLKVVNRALAGQSDGLGPPDELLRATESGREYLRLVAFKLSEKAEELRTANTRLRALINVGVELASERDPDRLLTNVCAAARDVFGATYVTLGIVTLDDRLVQRVVTCGTESESWIKPGDPVTGILGTVIAERRSVRGDNSSADSISTHFPVAHPEVQAFLAAPVASPANVYGWFCLVGNEGRSFDDDDEDLVIALSGQIGRIYENSYFQALAQKRTAELEHEIVVRTNAESALVRERDRAQQYLDAAQVILVMLDTDGRITLVNRFACVILGWPAEELLGCNWVDTCVPERARNGLRGAFDNLVAGDLSIAETPVLTKSGEERLIAWRNTLLRDDFGGVIGTFSSGADITERNRATDALRTAEERTRFALQNANVGIWDMDFITGEHRWSETLEAQYGMDPGTFGGTFEAFVGSIHPDDRESVLATVGEAMKAGSDFSVQHRTMWRDGTVRWLSGAGRVHLDAHGKPVRALGISMDVTDRRALEEKYQQAQKMEAIGRLAGSVAHDFNNLLTVILGNSELLRGDLPDDDPRQTDVAEIQKAGVSASGLTRQLLAFSRKEIIEPRLLDLNVVVAGMQAMLGRLIQENVAVVFDTPAGLAHVKADRGQVEQIVLNLAVNARDAMPDGGTLTIATANEDLRKHPTAPLDLEPGQYVVLTVTDTGTGMTPQVRARLFEPFFTTKETGQGTGLGMATVHSIVIRSGAAIRVVSEVGKGTTFKVYFPRATDAQGTLEVRPVSRPAGGSETVLVVEDSEGLRAVTRKLLERHGYSVLVAANADDAIRMFDANPSIDVLLTDVVLPGDSGPELSKRLLARRPALRVIYMSGYTDSANAIVQQEILSAGIAFLHKPFTSEALGHKIRDVLVTR